MKKTRVLILGGGFGGVYTALEFEKRSDPGFEITMVSEENFFLFTPRDIFQSPRSECQGPAPNSGRVNRHQ